MTDVLRWGVTTLNGVPLQLPETSAAQCVQRLPSASSLTAACGEAGAQSCDSRLPGSLKPKRWGESHPRYGKVAPLSACRRTWKAFASRGRSVHYESPDTYVYMEPGEDEVFLSEGELRARLRRWLDAWPGEALPKDLANFSDLDDAVSYLVDSACELEVGGGVGNVQWYEVRLSSDRNL